MPTGVAAANDGWERIAAFFATHLAGTEDADMCTYATETAPIDGSARARAAAGSTSPTPPSTSTTRCTRWPSTPLNIDFADPSTGPAARVAVELTEESARALVTAITSTLASGNGH